MELSPTNTALRVIAIFQIISGIYGIILVVAGSIGIIDSRIVWMLWFGIAPILMGVAGVLLWRRWKQAVNLSILIQMAQVPSIHTDGFTLNLGVAFNVTIHGIWLGQNGAGALLLGFNVVALAALIILLIFRPPLQAVEADSSIKENVD